ncbi:DUF5107 domain-containing protein [Sunxiuqinia sp. sy24]|uniref:DUF5107 domain-containing protein n=1 Tax=Sunxiuqinia sp. sy24 TaxID=3461495 RepID=UPI0040464CAB
MDIKAILIFLLAGFAMQPAKAQNASIYEESLNMNTYMFSEPDPVPSINRIYPYFRFDGYTDVGSPKDWKMVVLENPYIKVYVCPAVGGKIWGAIEKSTGKEFLYFNDVVKFRDVAMRGAWSSGGLEYNFGDIGHIPTCATPVDYALKENSDGSVSCVVGALDLPSRTKWNVEIKLEKDKAYFETKVSWFNTNKIPVSYYHWMNAAAKADGNLEFIYPGNQRIGHGGELGDWPIDNDRDISRYENNDFGIYKSYHVLGTYSDFFGGYWHDDDFGFAHHASYDDKPGKKIWIWGLSEQGMIWEDLLTDTNGQYIEYQAGKLFNQAAHSSTFTPFKHREFTPYDADVMHEIWFPLKETKGMVAASEYAVLNTERQGEKLILRLSPLRPMNEELVVKVGQEEVFRKKVKLSPLELVEETILLPKEKDFSVELGNNLLMYHSNLIDNSTDRPVLPDDKFNWESAYGLYCKGLELEKQRRYTEAHTAYIASLEKEPSYAPALNRLSLSYYRKQNLSKALENVKRSLAINTYDGLANYLYGLINEDLGKINRAKSGYSIASQDVSYRTASYTSLARILMAEQKWQEALEYIEKALTFNSNNVSALKIKALLYRKMNLQKKAKKVLDCIYNADATSLFYHFELFRWGIHQEKDVQKQVSNELPAESYLELASDYLSYGAKQEAQELLKLSPNQAIVSLWLAFLDQEHQQEKLNEVLKMPADMIFPHRRETANILRYFITNNNLWKLKYYLALQQWSKGNIQEAKQLFLQCNDEPDFVPFYLAKLKLFPKDESLKLQTLTRANTFDKTNWRLQLAWINYYKEIGDLNTASKKAKTLFERHPEMSSLGMLYARILLDSKKYEQCAMFLKDFKVLPFEGATEGRIIYHEVYIRQALKAYLNKDYNSAIQYAQDAKKWPKHLGVGKHYDVDERLDNYLLALAYQKQGDIEKAKQYFHQIMKHHTPEYLYESSKLYLQLKILQNFEKHEMLEELLQKNRENNAYTEWAIAKLKEKNHQEIMHNILNTELKIQAYDTKFVDEEFQLLTDVIEQMANH